MDITRAEVISTSPSDSRASTKTGASSTPGPATTVGVTEVDGRPDNQILVDTVDGAFAGGVDRQNHDPVGAEQGSGEAVGEVAGPAVEMRLEDHHQSPPRERPVGPLREPPRSRSGGGRSRRPP